MGDTLHYTDIELQNDDDVGYHFDDGAVEKSKQVELRRNKMKTIIVITRLFLAISIIIVVSVIGSTSYLLLKRIETRTFESQYDAIYEVIEIKVALEMGSLAYAGTSLAARYTSETSLNQQTGSQYLIEKNGFETEYTKLQLLTVARAISFNPMIDPSNAAAWESWASSKINSNPSLNYYDTSNLVNGSPKIYKRVNGVVVATSQNTDCSTIPTHNVYFPVWQIAPIATNTKAIMFDLHSELNRCRALNDLIDNKKAAITDIIQLVQDTSTRPSSIYFEPVIISNNIVGTVSIVFSWDSMFQDMIPNDINSLYLVLSSPTLTFTWIISNGVVSLIGKGDFHDTDYNHYKKTVIVDVSTMHFELNIYPSEKYSKSFYTSEPQRFTIAIVLVIAFIAVLFIVLDYLQSKNSGKLEKEATFKGGIIDQLFPSTVQDKLFKSAPSKVTRRSSGCAGCGTTNQSSSRLSSYLEVSMKSSLGGLCAGNSKKEVILQDSDPIADSYENSTVLFADLVGFTSWSENRSPTEVFKLLEGLFSAFDKRARIHKVFKVETIGDCYMAVTGVPDKDPHHAENMADFALDIMNVMNKMNAARKLQNEEVELQLRVGIASGPVTAGVVRADRARFQLFGDTVNTAARMEQNSIPSQIQVNEATYKLLMAGNYGNVLTQRDDKIDAKGKGLLTTYWLTQNVHHTFSV